VAWYGSWGGRLRHIHLDPRAGERVQLTNTGFDDYTPQVSTSRVVWDGTDGYDNEIFTWTQSDGVVRLTNNSYYEYAPQISGNRLVWYGNDGSDTEIFTWTPSGGTEQITNNSYNDTDPQVSGDRVVWQGLNGSDTEIFTWTPSGVVVQLTDNSYLEYDPQVSRDRVVWYGADGSDTEIFTWTAHGGVVQLTDNAYDDLYPQVSGDRIVWYGGSSPADYEIFTAAPIIEPTISELTPASGPAAGGASVIINGSNLLDTTAVTFGGVPASYFSVISSTQVTATSPAHTAGTVQVQVTTAYGFSADTAADDFTYVDPPTITGLSPDSGPVAGGVSVTITGTGFNDRHGGHLRRRPLQRWLRGGLRH